MPGVGNYDVQYTLFLKDQMTKTLQRVQNSTGAFNKVIDEGNAKFSQMFSAGNLAMAGVGAAAMLMGKSIKNAMDFEKQMVSFEVMLGSASQAKDMIADIQQFAKQTPFETSDLIDSTRLLLNYGVAHKKVMPIMKMFGDITAGDSEKLKSMSIAYGQMSSTGRLMGQDLNQMINAGFNPLQEISKRTGVSVAELKKEMERGAISVEMVEQAFRDATSEGGRFNGMMEKQSKTMSGQWSTTMDNFNLMLTKAGTAILPTLNENLKMLNGVAEGNKRAMADLGLTILKGPINGLEMLWDVGGRMIDKGDQMKANFFDLGEATKYAAEMTGDQLAAAIDKARSMYEITNPQIEHFLGLVNKQKELLEGGTGKKKTIAERSTEDLENQIKAFKDMQDKLTGSTTDMEERKRLQKEINQVQKEVDRRDLSKGRKGSKGVTSGGGEGTTISSRAPQYYTINIDQLVGAIYTKKESLNESDADTKRKVTELLTSALNDTQQIAANK